MIDKFRIEHNMEQVLCNTCKRINPEYHEMILQLKYEFFDNVLEMKAISLKILMDNFNTINKIDEADDGYTVYFRDHGQMNKIATLFGRRWLILDKRSAKIMGQDKMTQKSLFRHTQLLTLVNLKTKDTVLIKGIEYWIKAINKGGTLVLRRTDNGKKHQVTYKMIKDYFQLVKKYDRINDPSHLADQAADEDLDSYVKEDLTI
jgi:NMD protein affecting ribosome stability and mRNA decay